MLRLPKINQQNHEPVILEVKDPRPTPDVTTANDDGKRMKAPKSIRI